MFKKGQVWRNNTYGTLYRVVRVSAGVNAGVYAVVEAITGRDIGFCVHLGPATTARKGFTLIGNNYRERATTKAEKPPIDKETHNLIQNLRRDNKELRRQNKDLRDDIGDMASKLHLAFRDKFPGIAALWPTPEALPEQRGCRKEDC